MERGAISLHDVIWLYEAARIVISWFCFSFLFNETFVSPCFCKSKKLLGTVAGKPAAGELSGGETIIEEGEASIPIVGTWKTKTPNAGGYTEYFTFNSDKTGKSWEVSSDGIQGEEETFTYKIEDNKLIFSWKGGETYTSPFILSDNNLTIKDNATSTIFIRI